MTAIPGWMAELEGEDLAFVKKFVLASGSLKEIARQRIDEFTTTLRKYIL